MDHQISNQSRARRYSRCLATILLLVAVFLAAAQAKDRKPHTSTAIKVIANMSFDNKPATDMLFREVNGKPYLFVQLANAQGVVVVDISRPNKLKIVSSLSGPDAAGPSQLTINGRAAVLSAANDNADAQLPNKGELVLWDISEPKNPRMVQKFSGVLRVLRDDRNYTYVLNQDGLWVVYETPALDDSAGAYGG